MTTMSDRLTDGQLILDAPVALPSVLDLLIVGGGPLGTACAFRAKELGLAALVIEADDLMKRIRDYAKDKPILPDYGGGDTMAFPAGDQLVSALRFEPIDKDRMVAQWKQLYRSFSVPAQVGVELLHVERQPDGVWRAETRNHYTKQNQSFQTRTIVLGLGRGVPRRLDIPGDLQDLALRLIDARQFVGAAACVIGGGTSAAEAVIAISNAKAQSGADESLVYWSYRGLAMPKVSEALARDLFEVMMMNGNLRMALGSDPVAVTKRDGSDYLAICTSIREEAGKPREVVQLEFPKSFCVACIGADRPDPLLRALGVDFIPKESGEGDRIVASPLLETRRPGLFLAGDLLSPDYAEASDFDGHPSSFTTRSRRGNIKSALRDGVLLAEVVKQRLEGKQEIRVVIDSAPPLIPVINEAPAAAVPAVVAKGSPSATQVGSPASPGRLISLLADGTPADEFRLVPNGVTTIGRAGATVAFPQDTMLSDRHAAISHGPAGLELRDLGSQHGVYLKLQEGRDVELAPGTIVKAGRQWLVAREAYGGRAMVHYDANGTEVARHKISEGNTLVLGRTAPATILNADDSTLSRRHLSVSLDSGRLLLRDLGGRNGTFLKVQNRWLLQDGDLIWLGHELLRVVTGSEAPQPTSTVVIGKVAPPAALKAPSAPSAPSAPAVPPVSSKSAAEPSVTFGAGKPFPFGKSATLLDLALAKRVRIKYECRVGDCGKCRVTVTSGGEHLDPRTQQENKALRMVGHDEQENRLACLVTRVKGPVAVEIPK
jgi:pSer/pThr/pTyr-binding forkhead associated (FHA) protein/thioredoxin reductase/ferredoxin